MTGYPQISSPFHSERAYAAEMRTNKYPRKTGPRTQKVKLINVQTGLFLRYLFLE